MQSRSQLRRAAACAGKAGGRVHGDRYHAYYKRGPLFAAELGLGGCEGRRSLQATDFEPVSFATDDGHAVAV